jgi:hypothetical protein
MLPKKGNVTHKKDDATKTNRCCNQTKGDATTTNGCDTNNKMM